MPVVVVATIIPKPEYRDDVIAAMKQTIEQVHGEDGCELYALHANDDRLVMIERWTSRDALRQHGTGSPGLQQLNEALKGKLEGPLDVVRLDPVPAGDDAKGRL
ncbi:MAG TPA: putative quinol monooxygenase [Streptosporangiaceae bacterium]